LKALKEITGRRDTNRRMIPVHQGQRALKTSFCGHKIDTTFLPTTNCDQCWTFFFVQNQEFTRDTMVKYAKEGGIQELTNIYGIKFVKRVKWMALEIHAQMQKSNEVIAGIEAEQKKAKEDAMFDREYDIVDSDGNPVPDDVEVA
jgi:hypothetical protein